MSSTIFMALLRHILQFGGGLLVARGVIDSGTVETISGAVISIATVIWSQVDARGRS